MTIEKTENKTIFNRHADLRSYRDDPETHHTKYFDVLPGQARHDVYVL